MSSNIVVSSDPHNILKVVVKMNTSPFEPFLFAWRISWQYADPRYVQPSSHRPAAWCLVTTAYGHAAANMNVFELQLLHRQLALSL